MNYHYSQMFQWRDENGSMMMMTMNNDEEHDTTIMNDIENSNNNHNRRSTHHSLSIPLLHSSPAAAAQPYHPHAHDNNTKKTGGGGGEEECTFVRRYGEWLSVLLLVLVILFLLVTVVYLAYASAKVGMLEWTTFLSMTPIVMITIPIALQEIRMHLCNYYMPDIQKYVVRILWMVPIYSLQSWLALRVPPTIMAYVEPFRDWYEAYVLSSFVYYLIELCGGEASLAQRLSTKDPSYGHHPKIFFFLNSWEMGHPFLFQIKKGVLSFVIIKSLAAILIVICKVCGLYNSSILFYSIAILVSLALSYALHCLLLLYHATKEELSSWHPIYKFLCIKGVIFFTFWQGIAIILFLQLTGIHKLGSWDAHRIKKEAQDILVVIEMLFFAIAHRYTFSHQEYKSYNQNHNTLSTTNNHNHNNNQRFNHTNKHSQNQSKINQGSSTTVSSSSLSSLYTSNATTNTNNTNNTLSNQSTINNNNTPNHPTRNENNNNDMRLTQLSTPMSMFDAILNSHIPKETLKDLKRFGKYTVYGGGATDDKKHIPKS